MLISADGLRCCSKVSIAQHPVFDVTRLHIFARSALYPHKLYRHYLDRERPFLDLVNLFGDIDYTFFDGSKMLDSSLLDSLSEPNWTRIHHLSLGRHFSSSASLSAPLTSMLCRGIASMYVHVSWCFSFLNSIMQSIGGVCELESLRLIYDKNAVFFAVQIFCFLFFYVTLSAVLVQIPS